MFNVCYREIYILVDEYDTIYIHFYSIRING